MISNVRLIARLDIKQNFLIKGIHLEGWRKIGDPAEYSNRYYYNGVDELLYMDVVATLYGRNNLSELVEHTAREVFIPICVGGGVRSVDDADRLLRSGADKVAVNTAAIKRPALLSELATRFGSQAVVLSIEAKKQAVNCWEAYTDNGREHTEIDVIEWAARASDLGAGEILITSVDRDGTNRGADMELIVKVAEVTPLPIIASGGQGNALHVKESFHAGADAVAMASALHYNKTTLQDVKQYLQDNGFCLPHRVLPELN